MGRKKFKVQAQVENKRMEIALPLDYSFFQIKTPAEILRFPPRMDSPLQLKASKDSNGKWLTTALKLNKNNKPNIRSNCVIALLSAVLEVGLFRVTRL